ncbi:acetylxylan esterase [Streptomyces sp. NPDC060205]|uniref:acetylxylan esterase n=1 Tax=Streptomyces sp. NPDC060205 TaxID=3347072 RepID=UPI00365B0046
MAQFDMPLEELRVYRPQAPAPDDFDAFWTRTLAEARTHRLDAVFEPVPTPLTTVDVFDVTFAGYAGQPVKGWLVLPAGTREPVPLVVEFVGYGGGRGLPHSHLRYAALGCAHLVMDTRGQGSGWSVGSTADPEGSGPAHPGFLTRGIEDPDTFYYRRLIVDAVRAVEAGRSYPLTDATRTAVVGVSQGGGLALAAGGLVRDVTAVAPDVPFLSDFPRAIHLVDRIPYREVANYLTVHHGRGEQVLRTLSYFDGVHFAARARAAAFFSVALQDRTCPPSSVFAAFNSYGDQDKHIEVYPFNDHEGGGPTQEAAQLHWLAGRLGLADRAVNVPVSLHR